MKSNVAVIGLLSLSVLVSAAVLYRLDSFDARVVSRVESAERSITTQFRAMEETRLSTLTYDHVDSQGKHHVITTAKEVGWTRDQWFEEHVKDIAKAKSEWP